MGTPSKMILVWAARALSWGRSKPPFAMHQEQILLGKVFPSRILRLTSGSWHSLDGTTLNLCENLTPTTPPATQGPCPHPPLPMRLPSSFSCLILPLQSTALTFSHRCTAASWGVVGAPDETGIAIGCLYIFPLQLGSQMSELFSIKHTGNIMYLIYLANYCQTTRLRKTSVKDNGFFVICPLGLWLAASTPSPTQTLVPNCPFWWEHCSNPKIPPLHYSNKCSFDTQV